MKSKCVVSVANDYYTVVTDETEEYVQKVASYLNSKISEISLETCLPKKDAVVLAALNIGDEYFKALSKIENMRAQSKSCADETARAKTELQELKKELIRLKNNHR